MLRCARLLPLAIVVGFVLVCSCKPDPPRRHSVFSPRNDAQYSYLNGTVSPGEVAIDRTGKWELAEGYPYRTGIFEVRDATTHAVLLRVDLLDRIDNDPKGFCWSPGSDIFAGIFHFGEDNRIFLVDATDGRVLGTITISNEGFYHLMVFSDDGKSLLLAHSGLYEDVRTYVLPEFPPPDREPPTVPQNLRASNVESMTLDISWDASTDEHPPITYALYRNEQLVIKTTGTVVYDAGLTPQTAYTYWVTAADIFGNTSTPSLSVTATTLPLDDGPPPAPGPVEVVAITFDSVQLRWPAVAVADLMGYQVIRDAVVLGETEQPEFRDTTVTADTTFHYAVYAYDTRGQLS